MHTLLDLLPIASVIFLGGLRLLEIRAKRATVPGPVQERTTFRLFVLTGAVIAFGSIVEYLLSGRGLSWPFFALGWALGLTSIYIRRAAIAALGRFWSLHVEIRAEHEFVRSGPFRWVRHPVYFSMILELLSSAALCHAWVTALCIPLLYVPVLLRRVRLEERALVEKFGPRYEEYRQSTPAIFPRPW